MEPPENIGFRCPDHQSYPDPQYADKPFEWFVGKFCKLSFPVANHPQIKHELMWVMVKEVKEVEGKIMLCGELNNDPIYVTEYKCGDGVAFDRDEIHAVQA